MLRAYSDDGLREIRAMTIASLPCPPLPIMCGRAGADGDDSYICNFRGNSHDLLAHAMNLATATGSTALHAGRMARQQQVHRELLEAFDAFPVDAPPTPQQSYDLFAKFYRDYLSTYTDTSPDVRVFPLESILDTDAITRQMRSHVSAQNVLFGECVCREDSPWRDTVMSSTHSGFVDGQRTLVPKELSYQHLVQVCAKRIIEEK